MGKTVTPEAISIILANPCPDSSSDLPEIIVQVLDLKATGGKFMFMVSDGKMKVRGSSTSGNFQNLGLIRILDYILIDVPTKDEKLLIVSKCESVSRALDAEYKAKVKAEEIGVSSKLKQSMNVDGDVRIEPPGFLLKPNQEMKANSAAQKLQNQHGKITGNNRESFPNFFASSQNPQPHPLAYQNFQIPYPQFYFPNFPNYANIAPPNYNNAMSSQFAMPYPQVLFYPPPPPPPQQPHGTMPHPQVSFYPRPPPPQQQPHGTMPHPQVPFYPRPPPPPQAPDNLRHSSTGGSSSDEELDSLFEHDDCQLPPHSAQSEMGVTPKDEGNGRRSKATWTPDEEKCLVQACSTISGCSKDGNPPKNKEFWEKTTAYYNENRPKNTQPRTDGQVKSHYYQIMPNVNQFSDWYNNFYNNRASGQSDDDVLLATIDHWNTINPRKTFKYMHVWKVMKELEKQAPQHPNKKTRTSESEGHASTESEAESRPMKQQRAKKHGKDKVKITQTFDESRQEKWEKMQELQWAKLKQKERELEQKKIELEREDYLICMKDTSGMSTDKRRIHAKMVESIKVRRGWN